MEVGAVAIVVQRPPPIRSVLELQEPRPVLGVFHNLSHDSEPGHREHRVTVHPNLYLRRGLCHQLRLLDEILLGCHRALGLSEVLVVRLVQIDDTKSTDRGIGDVACVGAQHDDRG